MASTQSTQDTTELEYEPHPLLLQHAKLERRLLMSALPQWIANCAEPTRQWVLTSPAGVALYANRESNYELCAASASKIMPGGFIRPLSHWDVNFGACVGPLPPTLAELAAAADPPLPRPMIDFITARVKLEMFQAIASATTYIMRLLRAMPQLVNAVNEKSGWTLLHHAIDQDNEELVRFLVLHGANTGAPSAQQFGGVRKGSTPADLVAGSVVKQGWLKPRLFGRFVVEKLPEASGMFAASDEEAKEAMPVLVQLIDDAACVRDVDELRGWCDGSPAVLPVLACGELDGWLLTRSTRWAAVWPHYTAVGPVERLSYDVVVNRVLCAAHFVQVLHQNARVLRGSLHDAMVQVDGGGLRMRPLNATFSVHDAEDAVVYGHYRADIWAVGAFALGLVCGRQLRQDSPEEVTDAVRNVVERAEHNAQYALVHKFIVPCLDICGDDSVTQNLSLQYDTTVHNLETNAAAMTSGGSAANLLSQLSLLCGAASSLAENFTELARSTKQLRQEMEQHIASLTGQPLASATATETFDSEAAREYCMHFEMCWRSSMTYANLVLAGGKMKDTANWQLMVAKAIKFTVKQIPLFPGSDLVGNALAAGFVWKGGQKEQKACESLIRLEAAAGGNLGPAFARRLARDFKSKLEAEASDFAAEASTVSAWKDRVIAMAQRVLSDVPKSNVQKLAVAHCSAVLALIRSGAAETCDSPSIVDSVVTMLLTKPSDSDAPDSPHARCKRAISVLLDDSTARKLWTSSRIVISALVGLVEGEDIDLEATTEAGSSLSETLMTVVHQTEEAEDEATEGKGDETEEAAAAPPATPEDIQATITAVAEVAESTGCLQALCKRFSRRRQ